MRRLVSAAAASAFVTLALLVGSGGTAHSAPPKAALAQQPATGDPRIILKDSRLEELPSDATFTEGAAAAPDGSIYFSDIPRGKQPGRILRYDPKTGKTAVFREDSGKSNGLMFDAMGYLVACQGADYGARAVSRISPEGRGQVLAKGWKDKRFNAPNDLCIDEKGRIYFTDPRYLGDEPREIDTRAVYRIDSDGSVTQIITDVEKPNGVIISPDQKTLYVADHNNGTDRIPDDPEEAKKVKHGAMTLNAYPLSSEGTVGAKRVLVDYAPEAGVDGMTVDVEGNVYAAVRSESRRGIVVYNPQGKELAYIPTNDLPTNCCFGRGQEASTLYVTAGKGLYRIRLGMKGYHIPQKGGKRG